MEIKELIDKYTQCHPLTEEEIRKISDFYKDLYPRVEQLGPEFGLMKGEIGRRMEMFNQHVSFFENKQLRKQLSDNAIRDIQKEVEDD